MLASVLHALAADITGTSVAAAVAITALGLIAVAKPLAGTISAWSGTIPRGGPALAQAANALLVRGRQVLGLVLAGPAVALAVALPMLAVTAQSQPFAIALAGVAGFGLLARTRRAGFTAEAIPVGLAGSIGVFAVLAALAYRFLGAGDAVFALTTAAVGILGWGIALAVLRQPESAGRDSEPTLGGPPEGPDRYRWVDVIGMLCNIACAPLAMGVFGVFDELTGLGRGIIG